MIQQYMRKDQRTLKTWRHNGIYLRDFATLAKLRWQCNVARPPIEPGDSGTFSRAIPHSDVT
jgi:hypothetical protein